MTNMNANDFITAVDHAAGMNDRWLFLAAFCLLLVGVIGRIKTGHWWALQNRPV